MIDFFGTRDSATRRMVQSTLASHEEQAEGRIDLLEDLPKD
jgi:hypothetical protein